MKIILTIAGSDTSAGAGIQQDLKTITALGQYALTVTTALTAQNTMGVTKVMDVPDDMLIAQLDAVFSDFNIDAVKIGMLPSLSASRIVTERLADRKIPIVCDPVMISTSGTRLMSEECTEYVKNSLFPLCTLVTPNIPEARSLAGTGNDIDNETVGRMLAQRHNTSVLLKGGHGEGNIMCDTLFTTDSEEFSFCSPKVVTRNLHGTGCTMSSGVAAYLALGLPLPEAVRRAKEVIDNGIANAKDLTIGHGNGPLWISMK